MSQTYTVRQQLIRCGKKGCKSCPHGPYWHAFWKERKRTRSRYLGRELPAEYARFVEQPDESLKDGKPPWFREPELDELVAPPPPQPAPIATRSPAPIATRSPAPIATRSPAPSSGPHPHDAIFSRATATAALAKEILGITGLWIREQANAALSRLRDQLGEKGENNVDRLKRVEAAYRFLQRTNKWK